MAHANVSIGATNYSVAIMAGHYPLNADESVELGGKDSGPSPFELACAALCACTAITLRMYAQRKGWPLRAAHVDADFKWQDKKGVLARTLRFEGELNDDQRARLADIAERTPVTLILKQGLTITTTTPRVVVSSECASRMSLWDKVASRQRRLISAFDPKATCRIVS